MNGEVRMWALEGVPEVEVGADLAELIATAAASSGGPAIAAGDVVVIASKIVAKAEGRLITGIPRAELVDGETVRLVASRRSPAGITKVVQSVAGPVMAAAGIDASNLGGVEECEVASLLLPLDADASARSIRQGLAKRWGLAPSDLGVIVTDTTSRPWRLGVFDFALGAAGVGLLEDLRGSLDGAGRTMEVTVRALADEIASAADLVKGKSQGRPVAIVRGLAALLGGEGNARELTRTGATDWFKYGHVEAVRAALGVDPAEVEPPALVASSEDCVIRAQRAIDVATRAGNLSEGPWSVQARIGAEPDAVTFILEHSSVTPDRTPSDWIELGQLAERLRVAAWSEQLIATVTWHDPGAETQ